MQAHLATLVHRAELELAHARVQATEAPRPSTRPSVESCVASVVACPSESLAVFVSEVCGPG